MFNEGWSVAATAATAVSAVSAEQNQENNDRDDDRGDDRDPQGSTSCLSSHRATPPTQSSVPRDRFGHSSTPHRAPARPTNVLVLAARANAADLVQPDQCRATVSSRTDGSSASRSCRWGGTRDQVSRTQLDLRLAGLDQG